MKKTGIAFMMAAAVVVAAAAGTMAEEQKIEAGGLVFEFPEEYKDQLTIQTEGLNEGELIRVSETASIEAAGSEKDGAGLLFSICTLDEDKLKEYRCDDMSGMDVFAEKDGTYYVSAHPTDVTLARATDEEMEASMDQWTALNKWAAEDFREAMIADNGLNKKVYTNTDVDIHLARALFQEDAKYEIRSLDFGTLDPSVYPEKKELKELAESATFTYVDPETLSPEETPDGEYIVMAFDEERMQFDFFLGEDFGNYVRQTITPEDEDEEPVVVLFKASFEDPEKTATGMMKEYADAIIKAKEKAAEDSKKPQFTGKTAVIYTEAAEAVTLKEAKDQKWYDPAGAAYTRTGEIEFTASNGTKFLTVKPEGESFVVYYANGDSTMLTPYSDGLFYTPDKKSFTGNGDYTYTAADGTVLTLDMPEAPASEEEPAQEEPAAEEPAAEEPAAEEPAAEESAAQIKHLESQGSRRPVTIHFEGGAWFDEEGHEFYDQNDGTFMEAETQDIYDVVD